MGEKNVAPNFVTSPHFRAFVALISGRRFDVPCRWTIVARIVELHDRIQAKLAGMLAKCAYVGFELDSWTRNLRHFSALTSGPLGLSSLLAAYQNDDADTAVITAEGVNTYVPSTVPSAKTHLL